MMRHFAWIISIILVLSLALPIVSAAIGVAHPVPSTLELLRGEEGRFKFQIQAVDHPYDVECSYSLDDVSDLNVDFDVDNVLVEAGSSVVILGTVSAPDDAFFGVHEETFCVDCSNVGAAGGTQVLGRYCTIPIRVEVVPVRTRENVFVPPRPPSYIWVYVLVIAAVLIMALLVYLYIRSRRKRELEMLMRMRKVARKKKKK